MYPPSPTSPENPESLACKETRRKSDIAVDCVILLRSLQICVFWYGPKFYILLQAGPDSVQNFNLSCRDGPDPDRNFYSYFGPDQVWT